MYVARILVRTTESAHPGERQDINVHVVEDTLVPDVKVRYYYTFVLKCKVLIG